MKDHKTSISTIPYDAPKKIACAYKKHLQAIDSIRFVASDIVVKLTARDRETLTSSTLRYLFLKYLSKVDGNELPEGVHSALSSLCLDILLSILVIAFDRCVFHLGSWPLLMQIW